jgi:uncharacterized protein
MTEPISSLKAGYIKDTETAKGRGVFASRDIAKGELLEVCPVVIIKARWSEMPQDLQRIVFDWSYLTKSEPASCVVMGWGSLYNHSNPANVRYAALADELCMQFMSSRDIHAGEELTINYNQTGGDIHSTKDIWFEKTGITPV